jgi:5-enolpyruvylshikimate-3-phosphate synthase
MAEGTTNLSGLLLSDDTYWCADALRRLGAEIAVNGMAATVRGIARRRPRPEGPIHVGSSGTLARFLPPFLTAGEVGQWRVTASRQMTRRPVAPLFEALRLGGAEIAFFGDPGCFPAVFTGGSFAGGRCPCQAGCRASSSAECCSARRKAGSASSLMSKTASCRTPLSASPSTQCAISAPKSKPTPGWSISR